MKKPVRPKDPVTSVNSWTLRQTRVAVRPPAPSASLDVNERLAEMVIKHVTGQRSDVANWLRALGCTIILFNDHELLVEGLVNNQRVALTPDLDVVTTCVQLGFAVAGPYWTHVYPRALKIVNKWWTQQTKARKSKSAPTPSTTTPTSSVVHDGDFGTDSDSNTDLDSGNDSDTDDVS